jgi:hypothetical protein
MSGGGRRADNLTPRWRRLFSDDDFCSGGGYSPLPNYNALVITSGYQQPGNEDQYRIAKDFPFHAYSLLPFMLTCLISQVRFLV